MIENTRNRCTVHTAYAARKGESSLQVPLVDLKAQYTEIGDEIEAAVRRVLSSTAYIQGPDLAAFESAFAAFCGAKYAVGVASGLDALTLSLRGLDIGPGDEVITVAHTFIATTLAIRAAGAKPVLVDCDPETYNLDYRQLEVVLTPRTKAIVPVHLYGQSAEMNPLLDFARNHGLKVVEDACQAHGARYHNRPCGTMGDAGCFSFYPGKNLGAAGDGGMVVTDDADLARKLRMLRNYGQEVQYRHVLQGVNSRLDTLQAAILSVKLRYLSEWNARRRRHAQLYNQLLSDTQAVTPHEAAGCEHVFHLYVVRVPDRDGLLRHLEEHGIQAKIHYPVPVHLSPANTDLGYAEGSFPIAESYAREVLSLPMYPELTEEKINYVVDQVKIYLGKLR